VQAATLDRIRDTGKLTIGYVSDAPPFSYQDPSGKPAGYSIALCGKVAEAVKTRLGLAELAVDYAPVAASERMAAVKEGRIDLLCAEATGHARAQARRRVLDPDLRERHRRAPAHGLLGAPPRRALRPEACVPAALARDDVSGRWSGGLYSAVSGTTAETWLRGRKVALNIVAEVAPVDSYDAGLQLVRTARPTCLRRSSDPPRRREAQPVVGRSRRLSACSRTSRWRSRSSAETRTSACSSIDPERAVPLGRDHGDLHPVLRRAGRERARAVPAERAAGVSEVR
jgi:hypothetical protein